MAVIDNRTRNTVVSGTSDADSIHNYAKNVTINGGVGARHHRNLRQLRKS